MPVDGPSGSRRSIAIMQPYFLPYIGYFQLIAAVDQFIVYDNIEFSKGGWVNRNRLLLDGQPRWFSLPLRRDSDYLDIRERKLAPEFSRAKLLNQLTGAYRRSPFFGQTVELLEQIIGFGDDNLFSFIEHSIVQVSRHLAIRTQMTRSSDIAVDHSAAGQEKVLAICEAVGARRYINPIGGTSLYAAEAFRSRGIDLMFLRSHREEYPQLGAPFVPWLSIADVLMFNPLATVQQWVRSGFELIPPASLR